MHEPALFSTPFTFVHSFISLIFLLFTPSIYIYHTSYVAPSGCLPCFHFCPALLVHLFIYFLTYLFILA